MPLPTTAWAGTPCSDSPLNSSVPVDGCEREIALSSVLLPAPLGPSTATNSPSAMSQRHVFQRDGLAVRDRQVAQLKQHGWAPLRRHRRVRCRPRSPPGAAHDVVRRSPAAMTSPKSSAMTRPTSRMNSRSLCSISRIGQALVGVHLADQGRQVVDLAAAQAGEGLVEQQQRRLGSERARDLEPPLVAVGQHLDRHRLLARRGRRAAAATAACASRSASCRRAWCRARRR